MNVWLFIFARHNESNQPLKTVVFGFLIASAASYLGFNTSRGTEGVGEASTRSVVMGSMLIILGDVILVKVIFFFYPPVSG